MRERLLSVGMWLTAISIPFRAFAQLSVEVLPERKLFPSLSADGLAHQMSLTRVTENREWIGVIGGSVPLLEVRTPEIPVQAGIAASVFSRLIKTPGHITVATVDYRVDIPLDVEVSGYVFRVAYGHISSHFADDGIEILGNTSIPSVKDYLGLSVARVTELIHGHIDLGVTYHYHNEPRRDKRWMLHCGSVFGNYPLSSFALLYGAVSIKLKEEVGWGSTQSYQVGVRFFPRGERAIRLAYTLRRGYEDRGQFYTRSATMNLVSVFLDF